VLIVPSPAEELETNVAASGIQTFGAATEKSTVGFLYTIIVAVLEEVCEPSFTVSVTV